MAQRGPYISKTYYSLTIELPVATIVHGVYTDGDLVGVMMADIETSKLQKMVEAYNRVLIVMRTLRLTAHSKNVLVIRRILIVISAVRYSHKYIFLFRRQKRPPECRRGSVQPLRPPAAASRPALRVYVYCPEKV